MGRRGSFVARRDPTHAFVGHEPDPGTGLYQFGARVYDPALRRWLSPDPLLVVLPDLDERWGQQLNLYAYVANNPVLVTDEDGEFGQIAIGLLNGAREATRSAVVTFVASGGDAQATANAAIAGFSEGFTSGVVAAATGNFLLANAAGTAVGVTVQSALENGTLPSAGEVGTAVATSLGVGAAARGLAGTSTGSASVAGIASDAAQSRPFTKENFRHNVGVMLGRPLEKNEQAHHVLPQALEQEFKDRGVNNIHDPKYGAIWNGPDHQEKAKAYQRAWEKFLEKNKRATPADIDAFARQVSQDFGVNWGGNR